MNKPKPEKQFLTLDLASQPNDTSCGPTCLNGIYRYYGDVLPLETLMENITALKDGGTLGACLGLDALNRGYSAKLYSYNLTIFDPSWFSFKRKDLIQKLIQLKGIEHDEKKLIAIEAYTQFLMHGGNIAFEDLSASIIRKHLNQGTPILAGLSATYLYRTPREIPETCEEDDLHGKPTGHFVVITGYNRTEKLAYVADPYRDNPMSPGQHYKVPLNRLITSILLGIYTYDGNLLIIKPRKP